MGEFLTPLKMGDPKLLEKSDPVIDFNCSKLQQIIDNLLFTIQKIDERVGLAAPQVGIMKRIVIFRVPNKPVNSRYNNIAGFNQEEIPWTVLINPEITPLCSKTSIGWEGCISVPGLLGEVERYEHIRYTYYDRNGSFSERKASAFHARLIQHECDHLDGILFPMKLKNLNRFGFEHEIQKFFF
jgi:peptide deformylase